MMDRISGLSAAQPVSARMMSDAAAIAAVITSPGRSDRMAKKGACELSAEIGKDMDKFPTDRADVENHSPMVEITNPIDKSC
jgi:hypothetical protein